MLGGTLAQSGETLLAAVREAIYRRSHPLVTRDLRIVRSEWAVPPGCVGAAALVAEEMFAPNRAREWIAHATPRRQPSFEALLVEARGRKRRFPSMQSPPPPRRQRAADE